MRKKFILPLFICFLCIGYGQNQSDFKDSTINKNYNILNYTKVAKDTIKIIYDKQLKYISDNLNISTLTFISKSYRLEDLDLYSVPVFKLKNETYNRYDLSQNIEGYIDFEPNYTFQRIYIYTQDTLLNFIQIPDFRFESLKVHDPDEYFPRYKNDRNEKLMHKFTFSPSYSKQYRSKYINDKPSIYQQSINRIRKSGNFYFMIYGLTTELFEIDNLTGILYVNDIYFVHGRERNKRLPANEYILKYIGANVIKQLSRGYFDGKEEPIAHLYYYEESNKKYNANRKKVFLNFKRIE
ncbi:MAG: hypothetical protein V4572_00580 [Bacteroidota bacterium]